MMRRSLLLFCLFMSNFHAYSQWYESQGQASIIDGDHRTARTLAIEEALQKSLLVAGASISSIQQVVNGLLTQDQISIRASGVVNHLELINEQYADGIATVNIRADIFPQPEQCSPADYRKSILITRTNLIHREQANSGKLYAIDQAVSKKISHILKNAGNFITVQHSIKSKTEFSRYYNSLHLEKIKQLTLSLANITNNQYVMYSQISDISLANEANNQWQFWQYDVFDRHFDLSIFIYNGVNGEQVFEQHYQNVAPWTYDKRAEVDVNSASFWQSEYGLSIAKTLDLITNDIDEVMMCQQSRGKIVQIEGNSVMINLGRKHGVKLGDTFSVVHHNNIIADDGKEYAGYNISSYNVVVNQLSNESARAMTKDGKILGSVQLDDLVVRH